MLNLLVPNPCSQKWDTMQPGSQGRFCDQCCKTVIDFTEASDEELVLFFSQKQEKVCGRFREDQLDRKISFSEPEERSFFRHRIAQLAATLLFVQTATPEVQGQEQPISQQIILKGSITDHLSQKPMQGMIITVDGLNYPGYSDKNGAFSIKLPTAYWGKTVVVHAIYRPGSSFDQQGFIIREAQVVLPEDGQYATVQLQRFPFQELDTVAIESYRQFIGITGEVYIAPEAVKGEQISPLKREKISFRRKLKSLLGKKK